MQSSKHLAALGLLGVVGIFMAAGSKKERFDIGSIPTVDRRQAAMETSQIISASDACVRAHAADPNAIDLASYQSLREACLRAAEDEARNLEFRDDDWDVVHPGTDTPASNRIKSTKNPRVARRTNAGTNEDSSTRNR